MPRNSAPSQSRFRPPLPPRSKSQSSPQGRKSRTRRRGPAIDATTERFTVSLGDIVVRKDKTAVASAPSLLPSDSNLSQVLGLLKNYSLHRPSSFKVTFRPSVVDLAGNIALALDPAKAGTHSSTSAVRGYSLSAGGPIVSPHTLSIPARALSHLGWSSYLGSSPQCPGWIPVVAQISSPAASDLTLGSLELSGVFSCRGRRPLS